ncbi:MAG: Asp-tRNA(Asn)/Glu-tRNA(Gln) amidotransferase GatCAB subunit A [Hyphomicrobiales bacterium]|nr:MAG: Asp-tRNA(Asn)/Glu-tRNA(Gln) amidotransferase GatCAB subunit A [Hyphomicrobiales bacterium]
MSASHIDPLLGSVREIASAVHEGELTARDLAILALDAVDALNPKINAFTDVLAERVLAEADALDERYDKGEDLPPLSGVPYGAKNLFDIAGLPTLAGSKINADHPPAAHDATLIARLQQAGGLLVGALHMGEYAYDFTGENAHDGNCRNPHNTAHMTGGSSSGSGAAVAAAMLPFALGTDTNGSIRVPSSFCGLFGLKPTFGRLSRAGTFPLAPSLDHVGPLARSVGDLAYVYDACRGYDPRDPANIEMPSPALTPEIEKGIDGLRVAVAGGWFRKNGFPEAYAATDLVAKALGADQEVEIPEAGRARAAAYVITAAEAGSFHLDRLRTRAEDFDPDTRDRLLSGAMLPAAWLDQAQRFRSWYREKVARLFEAVDLIIAPATPCHAPKIGQKTFVLDGVKLPTRPNIGIYTQPISFIGLPVVAVPLWLQGARLPIGVQIIAAPWREDLALRAARVLEANGVAKAPTALIAG